VEQTAVISAMEKYCIKPSLSQAKRIKTLKQDGELTIGMIDEILSESKKPTDDNEDRETTRFRKYFPDEYTTEQINIVIIDLLREWQQSQTKTALKDSA
jgi:ParB family chromosome partitioning protein